jgi:hypothetical protein
MLPEKKAEVIAKRVDGTILALLMSVDLLRIAICKGQHEKLQWGGLAAI